MKALFIFGFFTCAHLALAQIKVTEAGLDGFFAQNPELQALKQRLEASEKIKGVLTRSFLPKVDLTYGQERYSTGPYHGVVQPFGGIEARVNLFNSGKDYLEDSIRQILVGEAGIDRLLVQAKILAETRKAMAQYAYLMEVSKVLKLSMSSNQENLKNSQRRTNSGLSTRTDSVDFRQETIMLQLEAAKIEYEVGVVKRLVSTYLGLDSGQEITIDYLNQHPEHGSGQLSAADGAQSLVVKKFALQAEVAQLEASKAKRWWAPSVDVYGFALRMTQKDREYPTPSERNDKGFGVRFTFPIFDGGEGFRQAQSKAALAMAQESMVRSKQLELNRETRNAKEKLRLAHDLIHGAEESAGLMDEYRRQILEEYNRGIKNSPDVLQALQRWIQTNTHLAEVKKNYQFARADMLYYASLLQ